MTDDNKFLITELEKLIKQIMFEMNYAKNTKERLVYNFRWQAIEKVVDIIKKFPEKITSIDQLRGIKGIGKGSLNRIDEILRTGKLSEINPEQEEYQKYVEELQA